MAEPYMGEIRLFPFAFAPKGWAHCDGMVLPVMQNQSLFVLLGTYYGGDGQVTFALPDLRGRVPIHVGQAHDLGPRHTLGETGGAETHTLSWNEMAAHSHTVQATSAEATVTRPADTQHLWASQTTNAYGTTANAELYRALVTPVGEGQAHTNMQPYLALNFCIALYGTFPTRS